MEVSGCAEERRAWQKRSLKQLGSCVSALGFSMFKKLIGGYGEWRWAFPTARNLNDVLEPERIPTRGQLGGGSVHRKRPYLKRRNVRIELSTVSTNFRKSNDLLGMGNSPISLAETKMPAVPIFYLHLSPKGIPTWRGVSGEAK